tara:strand:- start:4441 stop:4860 length:420 start_codon:yes stop_codon:yes gene_type:complete
MGAPIKILLVEDEEFDIITFMQVLQGIDIETDVRVARTGQEAVVKLNDKTWVPNLVLLDQVLPDMSGNDIARLIRVNKINTRIVRLTGHPEKRKSKEDICLVKPCSPAMLELVLRTTDTLHRVTKLSIAFTGSTAVGII